MADERTGKGRKQTVAHSAARKILASSSPKSKKTGPPMKVLKKEAGVKKKGSPGSSRAHRERSSFMDTLNVRSIGSYSKDGVRPKSNIAFEPFIIKDNGRDFIDLKVKNLLNLTAGKVKKPSREPKRSQNNSNKTIQMKSKGKSNSGLLLETSVNDGSVTDDLKEHILFVLNRLYSKMNQDVPWTGDMQEFSLLLAENTRLKMKMKVKGMNALARVLGRVVNLNMGSSFQIIMNS